MGVLAGVGPEMVRGGIWSSSAVAPAAIESTMGGMGEGVSTGLGEISSFLLRATGRRESLTCLNTDAMDCYCVLSCNSCVQFCALAGIVQKYMC